MDRRTENGKFHGVPELNVEPSLELIITRIAFAPVAVKKKVKVVIGGLKEEEEEEDWQTTGFLGSTCAIVV